MPGIFGFTKNMRKSSIHAMQKSMLLHPSFKKDIIFEDELVAASRVHLNKIGEKNSPTKLSGNFAWVEGEAYNLSELSDVFGYDRDTSISKAILYVYNNNQLDMFLNKLDGYFCAVIYDKNAGEIKLISDRYGMRMLYWYLNDGQLAWASEVKGILALDDVDKKIDSTSFSCFFDLGHLLGTNTWFDKIKLIRPATVVTIDLSNYRVNQDYYWSWSEIAPSSLSFEDAVDELGTRFIKAVERRFDPNEKVGITLSGGLDSRVILAAIDHLYPDYKGTAFTFGIDGCDDIKIAQQVVKKVLWNHKEYHFTSDNWFHPRLEKIWNTDGMKDMLHMHGGEFVGDIASNIDINLNGYLGDAIFGGSYLKNERYLNSKISMKIAESYYNGNVSEDDLDPDFYNINHIDPYLFMSRGRRFINMGTVNSLDALEQRKPFFDNDCVELIYSLPDEFRLNNKLYSAMLQKFFPKLFKDIPWQQTGKVAGVLVKKSTLSRAIGKGVRLLKSSLGISSTQSYTDYKSWIRTPEVSSYLIQLLKDDAAQYRALTENDVYRNYLLPHLKLTSQDHSRQVLRTATVEIYLKRVKGID